MVGNSEGVYVYSREDGYAGRPIKIPGPGHSCKVFNLPRTDLFPMKANAKLPIYVSPVPEPMMWKQDDFQHSWDNLKCLCILSICTASSMIA